MLESSSSALLQSESHIKWMKEALNVGKKALACKEVPVGCVIVYENEIIGEGHNQTNLTKNPTRHAEFEAIDQVLEWCKQNNKNPDQIFQTSTLYVTCEPCIMCASALKLRHIQNIVFGCNNDRFGGCGGVLDLCKSPEANEGVDLDITKGVCTDEAILLLQSFYACENPFAPEPKSKENRKKPSDIIKCD